MECVRCHLPLQKNLRGMPDVRPKIHPSIESRLSLTISTPTRIRSASFLLVERSYRVKDNSRGLDPSISSGTKEEATNTAQD